MNPRQTGSIKDDEAIRMSHRQKEEAPMTNRNSPRREVVGILTSRPAFDQAVQNLLAAGFDRSDLSVLSSHDSLDASETSPSWRDSLVGLLGELKYEGPLVTAGFIAIAAGPVGAVLGALIATGVGGIAAKELMDKLTARPHAEAFAKALTEGNALLWVYAADPVREAKAIGAFEAAGARNVHVNQRQD
jgi:hypothetical protein